MAILRSSTTTAAANVVAFACSLGVVTALPAWAGATRVVSNIDAAEREAHNVVLSQVKNTVKRDWWLSLAAALVIALGATTFLSALGWFTGWRLGLMMTTLAVLYLAMIALLVSYIRSAGTLPMQATRAQVMEQSMRRIIEYPLRSVAATLVMLVCAPIWVVAPLAIAFGITLPLWLVHLIWRRIEVGVSDDDELWGPDDD